MEPRRLVWVRTGDPKGSGTGYLIGPQLVLTALHVVCPRRRWAGRVAVRVGHPRFGDVVQRSAEVCWPDPRHGPPPEDPLDVALIWLDEAVTATGDGPVRWGRPNGVTRIPFRGAGFPAFAADTASAAQFEALTGTLSAVSTSRAGWVLDSEVWPARGAVRNPRDADGHRQDGDRYRRDADGHRRDAERGLGDAGGSGGGSGGEAGTRAERPWAGASGAAIFHGDRLIGIAVEDSEAMEWRRLHAVPVHEALGDAAFADLVTRKGHRGTTAEVAEVPAAEEPAQIEIGPVPALASAFQPRAGLRERIERARTGTGSVILTQGAETGAPKLTQILSGGGGVGKTQLAAACAGDALREGTDLVVWVPATEAQRVVTQYARTAAVLRLTGADGKDPEADARALLEWLTTTRRRWLVVLDDITDPAALTSWWPASRTGTGWVLATTRRIDARLTGGDRVRVPIDVYSEDEAVAYLRERLTGEDLGRLLDDRVAEVAEALGRLPLALGLAAAHMINEDLTCAAYLELFGDRRTRLEEALPGTSDAEGYGHPIATALLLSLEAAQAADPLGLALPALRLVSLLDPAGHPHALWATDPVLDHLTQRLAPAEPVTAARIRSALRLLHRYALITCDPTAEPRAVRVHALTARAVREKIPDTALPHLTRAAADALMSLWPAVDQSHPELAAALRANTETLAEHTGDHLWHHTERHPVLHRAGRSLYDAGMAGAATAYWQELARTAERVLGAHHPDTLVTRHNLAISHQQAGRTDEAIALHEQVLAESGRVLGPDHPHTLDTRHNLATSYRYAGRTKEAITLEEQVLADRERVLGRDHPNTLDTRHNLATSYRQTGRITEAVTIEEQVLADSERVLGADHPDTLTTRHNLASSYRQAGRTTEAVALHEQVRADRERVLGAHHPDTLTTLDSLATAYQQAGLTAEAVALKRQVLTDRERVLGPDHPHTFDTRHNLAVSYLHAGSTTEAVLLLREVLAGRERALGPHHPELAVIRSNLALALWQAGATGEAIAIQEQVLDHGRRNLGPRHPDTLTTGNNLAHSYLRAGRLAEALPLLERVLADREQVLGARHPATLTTRSNLATAYERAGHVAEAVSLQSRVLTEREEVLGPDHPNTLTSRHNLGTTLSRANRPEEAADLLRQVLAAREQVLGPDHPDTLITRDTLATLRPTPGPTPTDPPSSPEHHPHAHPPA